MGSSPSVGKPTGRFLFPFLFPFPPLFLLPCTPSAKRMEKGEEEGGWLTWFEKQKESMSHTSINRTASPNQCKSNTTQHESHEAAVCFTAARPSPRQRSPEAAWVTAIASSAAARMTSPLPFLAAAGPPTASDHRRASSPSSSAHAARAAPLNLIGCERRLIGCERRAARVGRISDGNSSHRFRRRDVK